MRRRDIRNELREIADELDRIEVRRETLYARRAELWHDGFTNPDPDERMTQPELAEPSRVSPGAVTQALRKIRLRAENGAVPR